MSSNRHHHQNALPRPSSSSRDWGWEGSRDSRYREGPRSRTHWREGSHSHRDYRHHEVEPRASRSPSSDWGGGFSRDYRYREGPSSRTHWREESHRDYRHQEEGHRASRSRSPSRDWGGEVSRDSRYREGSRSRSHWGEGTHSHRDYRHHEVEPRSRTGSTRPARGYEDRHRPTVINGNNADLPTSSLAHRPTVTKGNNADLPTSSLAHRPTVTKENNADLPTSSLAHRPTVTKGNNADLPTSSLAYLPTVTKGNNAGLPTSFLAGSGLEKTPEKEQNNAKDSEIYLDFLNKPDDNQNNNIENGKLDAKPKQSTVSKLFSASPGSSLSGSGFEETPDNEIQNDKEDNINLNIFNPSDDKEDNINLHISDDSQDKKLEDNNKKVNTGAKAKQSRNSRKQTFTDFKSTVLTARTRSGPATSQPISPIIIDDDSADPDFKPEPEKKAARGSKKGGRRQGSKNKGQLKGDMKAELEKYRLELSSLKDVPKDNNEETPPKTMKPKHLPLLTRPKSEFNLDEVKWTMRDFSIEERFIDLIYNSCLLSKLNISWDDIGGLDGVKDSMKEMVIYPLLRPDIFTGLRAAPKGILLYGPPGTGKTMIAQCLASQCQYNFFNLSASSLTSKWVGDGEKTVQALFAVARIMQPSVIFIDEADSILSKRTEKENDSAKRLKTEFLVQMDGAATNEKDNVLVVAATNRPGEIDEAVRRRLVKRFLIPLPDSKGRLQIIKNLMAKEKASISDDEFENISLRANGYSGADLKKICSEASHFPIRGQNLLEINVDEIRPITADDLMSALENIKPSVSTKDLAHYRDFDRTYGDKP